MTTVSVTPSLDNDVETEFMNIMNTTASFADNVTSAICVLCTYRLQPWLKGVRVGFGSLIVLANVVIFVCLQRARNMTTTLRLFLSNVSVVDGLYGLGFLYHSAIVDFPAFIIMNMECKLRYGFLCMVSMVAMFTLMAMCVERVIALLFPFSYRRLVTKTNMGIAMAFFWLVPLGLVLPAYVFIDGDIGECNFVRFIAARSFMIFSVMYFTFMIVTVICQAILYFTAKSQIRKILPTLVGDRRQEAAFKMTMKATSTTLSMAIPFVVCSTPKIVTYMYLAVNPDQRLRLESLTTLAITVYLNVSHSLVNPFIYIWRLPQVRAQFFSLFLLKDLSSMSSRDDFKRESCEKRKAQISSSTGTKADKGFYWTEAPEEEERAQVSGKITDKNQSPADPTCASGPIAGPAIPDIARKKTSIQMTSEYPRTDDNCDTLKSISCFNRHDESGMGHNLHGTFEEEENHKKKDDNSLPKADHSYNNGSIKDSTETTMDSHPDNDLVTKCGVLKGEKSDKRKPLNYFTRTHSDIGLYRTDISTDVNSHGSIGRPLQCSTAIGTETKPDKEDSVGSRIGHQDRGINLTDGGKFDSHAKKCQDTGHEISHRPQHNVRSLSGGMERFTLDSLHGYEVRH